jgi:hypothetical protein
MSRIDRLSAILQPAPKRVQVKGYSAQTARASNSNPGINSSDRDAAYPDYAVAHVVSSGLPGGGL